MDPVSRTPTKAIDYAALSAGYGTLLGAVVVAARDCGADPIRPSELPALGAATFALSKLVAKEKVDSWVREPFLDETPDGERRPKGRRLRYAIGELLSCTRCVGTWTSLGLVGLRLLRPREARVIIPVLASSALNDWLHSGFTALCAQANVAQRATSAPAPEAGGAPTPAPEAGDSITPPSETSDSTTLAPETGDSTTLAPETGDSTTLAPETGDFSRSSGG